MADLIQLGFDSRYIWLDVEIHDDYITDRFFTPGYANVANYTKHLPVFTELCGWNMKELFIVKEVYDKWVNKLTCHKYDRR